MKIILLLLFLVLITNQIKAQDNYKPREGAVEIIDKRTKTSKTFKNPDGSFTAVLSQKIIHKLNSNGIYEEIEGNGRGGFGEFPDYLLLPRKKVSDLSYSWDISSSYFIIGNYIVSYEYTYRTMLRWDTDVIPDGATINTCSIDFNVNTNAGGTFQFYLNPISTIYSWPGASGQQEAAFIDCGDGTAYGNLTGNSSTSTVEYTGNSAFKTDLQNRLANDWMSVGLKNNNESNTSNYLILSNGLLVVDYTAPPSLHLSSNSWSAPEKGGTSGNFNVSNNGGGGAITYTVSEGLSWLSVSSSGGNTPSSFTITANPNYTAVQRSGQVTVTATSPSGVQNSPQVINVSQNPASTITLPTDEVTGLELYLATNWIEANTFSVGKGGDVESLELGAVNYVNLKPGFHASPEEGDFFRAYIFSESEDGSITNAEQESLSGDEMESNLLRPGVLINSEIPTEFDVSQNFPNPFNPVTTIKYALPVDARVSIRVYDMLGKEIAILVDDNRQAGYYNVNFNASNISSGIYFYRIIAGDFVKSYKMVILK